VAVAEEFGDDGGPDQTGATGDKDVILAALDELRAASASLG